MRDLEDRYKISVRGIEEVDDALGAIVARFKNKLTWKTHEEKPSKLGRASAVLALILWLEGQPEAEQRRVLADGLRRLDAHLASDATDCDGPPPDGPVTPTSMKPGANLNPKRRNKGAG